MKIDFEDYLMEKHSEQYIGLDDDMPDDFNDWVYQLDPQEIIDFAQAYAKSVYYRGEKCGMDRAIKILNK